MDTNLPELASIGIDIGKDVFHLVGFSVDGQIAFRRKIKRLALVESRLSRSYRSVSWAWKRASAPILSAAACDSSVMSHASFQPSM
jgi:hypothetical protein